MTNYVITIARGFGSGGKQIAIKLSEELGIPCYDKQILEMASESSGIDEALFLEADEKIRGKSIKEKLENFIFNYVVEPVYGFVSDQKLFDVQAEIIRNLAKTESCIIIGKCANMILKDYPNVISVYIEAPRRACLDSVMEKLRVSEEEAAKMIVSTDAYRSEYYKTYTGGEDWTNPTAYDMTLNSDRVGRDNCVECIKKYIDIKFG